MPASWALCCHVPKLRCADCMHPRLAAESVRLSTQKYDQRAALANAALSCQQLPLETEPVAGKGMAARTTQVWAERRQIQHLSAGTCFPPCWSAVELQGGARVLARLGAEKRRCLQLHGACRHPDGHIARCAAPAPATYILSFAITGLVLCLLILRELCCAGGVLCAGVRGR